MLVLLRFYGRCYRGGERERGGALSGDFGLWAEEGLRHYRTCGVLSICFGFQGFPGLLRVYYLWMQTW